MLAIAGALLIHFWRKGWIGDDDAGSRDGNRQ